MTKKKSATLLAQQDVGIRLSSHKKLCAKSKRCVPLILSAFNLVIF